MGAERRVRARVMLLSAEAPAGERGWREAELSIDGGIRVRYLKPGSPGGEDFFSLSSVSDLGFRVPSYLGVKEAFAVRFEESKVLVMAPGRNPLIYSREGFEDFVHAVFEVLLRGRPAFFWDGGRGTPLWSRGYLRVVGRGRLVVVGPDGSPVVSFPSVVRARVEAVGERRAWFLERYTPLGITGVYLHLPEKKTRLFVLRYLARFLGGAGYLPGIAGEFPEVLKGLVPPEISAEEREVLMALMSGMDPLELPGLLRMDPRRVEEIYDRLIRKGLLRLVGIRKVVEPTPLAEMSLKLEGGSDE